MTEERIVDAMCDLLRERVAPEILLKKNNDNTINAAIEWVHPLVYAVNLPFSQEYDPKLSIMLYKAPSITVVPEEASEDREGRVTQNLRIFTCAWDPGVSAESDIEGKDIDLLMADQSKGWRSASTLSEMIRRVVLDERYIGGAVVSYPLKFGTLYDDKTRQLFWPYTISWLRVPLEYIVERALPRSISRLID